MSKFDSMMAVSITDTTESEYLDLYQDNYAGALAAVDDSGGICDGDYACCCCCCCC